MSTFYPQNDYRGYLSHHGIKGQKWGEQNGPPYPLSTKIHNMVVRGKQKRAAKRREKILHDPAKLTKHASEFSKEEIDEAIAKIDSINNAKKRIPSSKRDIRRQTKIVTKEANKLNKIVSKEKAKAEKKLTKKMEKYGSNPALLEANARKFTPSELKVALERVQTKQKVFDAKMDSLNKPKKMFDLGLGYLESAINAVKKIKEAKRLFTSKYNEFGQTEEQENTQRLIEKAYAESDPIKQIAMLASSPSATKQISSLIGNKGTLSDRISGSVSSEKQKTIDSQRERIRELESAQAVASVRINTIDKDTIDILNQYLQGQEDEVRRYFDKDNLKLSDPKIDWSIFSDIKMSDIDDIFS